MNLITFAALYRVRFIQAFWRRAEVAPMIPGIGGHRNFALLSHQLAEQVGRPLPREVQAADPAPDMGTIASVSDPEMISDDDERLSDNPAD